MRNFNTIAVLIDDTVGSRPVTVFIALTTYIAINQHTRMHIFSGLTQIVGDVVFSKVLVDFLITTEHTQTLQTPQATVLTLIRYFFIKAW